MPINRTINLVRSVAGDKPKLILIYSMKTGFDCEKNSPPSCDYSTVTHTGLSLNTSPFENATHQMAAQDRKTISGHIVAGCVLKKNRGF